jgi:glycine dehydrogenase subunit 1
MHKFIANTEQDRQDMLQAIGAPSIEALFSDIPKNLRFNGELNLEHGYSELEMMRLINELASENKSLDALTCFRGAGAYDHYIPTTVKHLAGRSEFYTAYTPYQPEISQGTLQVIFEYQSMLCELTGMDASNASMYDGPTAAVEAAIMAAGIKKKNKIVVSKGLNPEARSVIKTYFRFRNLELVEVELENGKTNVESLKVAMGADVAGVIVQSPNFLGMIEDMAAIGEAAKASKTVFIAYVDPISLALLDAPGNYGADIVIGEGQGLGNVINFGGPYLGFLATRIEHVRKVPGRIVGQSEDLDGKRAFVLTLQAREQHIRRYKATSNICSNQGLNVLMGAIYMSTLGREGLKEVAKQSFDKAHYAYDQLIATGKFKPAFEGKGFFKEFALVSDIPFAKIDQYLIDNGVLGGFSLAEDYGIEGGHLFCVTEKRSKAEIDRLCALLEVI